MDDPEGLATTKTSEDTLIGNLDQGEDKSDVLFEGKGSEVFVDEDNSSKVDSEIRTEDLDGGINFAANDDNETFTSSEMEFEARSEDVLSGAAQDDFVKNGGGIDSVDEDSKRSEEQHIPKNDVFICETEEKSFLNSEEASLGFPANTAGVSSSSVKNQDCPAASMDYPQNHFIGVALIPKNEETSFKDEELVYVHVADAGVSSSLEKGEDLVKIPTHSEKVDIPDFSDHDANRNSDTLSEPKTPQRQTVGEGDVALVPTEEDAKFEDSDMLCDSVVNAELSSSEKEDAAALIPTEEDTKMEDVDMHNSKLEISQGHCKDDTFMPREVVTISADVIDCSGHESNKVSDSPSETSCSQSQVVREEETRFKDKAMCDAGPPSSEKGEGLLNNPTFSEEIDMDCFGHETNNLSDSLSEPMLPHSQTVAEGDAAALIPTEEDTTMEDADMHNSKPEISQWHCKDDTLNPREVERRSVSPTVSEKTDIDWFGHGNDKTSVSLSQSCTVADDDAAMIPIDEETSFVEYTTSIDSIDLNELVAEHRPSSLGNPTICEEPSKANDEQHHEEEKKELYSDNPELKQQEEIQEKQEKPINIYPGFLHPPGKTGKFTVSDLVWGKVRSHPWWPGQIFDPADASEKAIRYYRKGSFLVAYFGDRTFAWNDASLLKPFSSHFSQIEKQSTSETFQNAVRCALEEVSRRVQLGLSCSCTPNSKIACQVVENAGIREESSRVKPSVDHCVNWFSPHKLLQFLRGKACSPSSPCDQLDLVIAKAQLLAHSHFMRFGELSDFLQGGELLEENDNHSLKERLNSEKIAPNPPLSHLKGDCAQPETATTSMNELFSQLQLVARTPTGEHKFLNTLIQSILSLRKRSKRASKKRKGSQVAVNDSYWTDMIVQNNSEEQPLQHSVDSWGTNKPSTHNKRRRRSNSNGTGSTPDRDAEKRKQDPAELILKFGEGDWLPSEMNLNKIFRRFGPIKELETEVHPECCRGRVVFKKGCDAEVAYSSAGKFNIFGSLHVSYEINYTPVISVRPVMFTLPQEQEQEGE